MARTRKLKTETCTPEMDERIQAAFEASDYALYRDDPRAFSTVFEHGQWWVTRDDGAQFSVVDAAGGAAIDGFDFEQVTQGEEG